jgi:hypothetical protein
MSLLKAGLNVVCLMGLVLSLSVNAKPVYRCPGKPVLYTDALSPKEAQEKNCTTLEGAPITIISSQKTYANKPPAAGGAPNGGAGNPATRIDPTEQRTRDTDAKKILEAELRKEEDNLQQLKKTYNNGEPECQGGEANYQKYLDRVAELKAAVARKEDDIGALKRELSKLP